MFLEGSFLGLRNLLICKHLKDKDLYKIEYWNREKMKDTIGKLKEI